MELLFFQGKLCSSPKVSRINSISLMRRSQFGLNLGQTVSLWRESPDLAWIQDKVSIWRESPDSPWSWDKQCHFGGRILISPESGTNSIILKRASQFGTNSIISREGSDLAWIQDQQYFYGAVHGVFELPCSGINSMQLPWSKWIGLSQYW